MTFENWYNYITISRDGDNNCTEQIVITEETIQEFYNELIETINLLGWQDSLKIKKTYSVEDIKQKHSRAYEKWTSEEEAILVSKFKQKMSIEEIELILERQPSAINSRLQKLGLK